MNNKIYIYDGSFEGLLTIVYESIKEKQVPKDIMKENTYKLSLFEKYEIIENNYKYSARIIKSLKKISDEALYNSYTAFLSDVKGKEMSILYYIIYAFKYGKHINRMTNLEVVVNIKRIVKKVKNEVHKFKGFVRFKELDNKILYASIEPTSDVLELICSHFKNRLKNEMWMIEDTKRYKTSFYYKNNLKIMNTDKINFNKIKENEDEGYYQKLWQSFYKSVSIKERKNLKCQMNFMPKKYWKYMVETKNE